MNNKTAKLHQSLIVIGGRTHPHFAVLDVNCYDPQTGTWRQLPSLSRRRANFAAVVTDQRNIIISGGYCQERNQLKSSDSVEMFEWLSKAWKELPKMPVRLGSHSIAIHGDHLYIAGGEIDNRAPLSTLYRYSLRGKQWKQLESMKVPRTDGHLIAYRSHLYAIGGGTSTVEKYDPPVDEWTMVKSTKNSHKWFGATLHRDKIYVCGKLGFEVYDPQEDVWTSLPGPAIEHGTCLVSMNDKLLMVGGNHIEGDVNRSDLVQEFNFQTGQWSMFCRMKLTLSYHCSVVGSFH